ncbi:hypothetical protein RchiOBHm_Chr5g0047171 [Rosa chinensis]|uniref:Uncharacterized protein n=1 Tax=Rosa chinensis TaxID=74649 RepID=A0A2P6QE98_ROSCH|nr:hypothetical protein RchiOBHm_Chr5g0047171 [Rosa chinensis]
MTIFILAKCVIFFFCMCTLIRCFYEEKVLLWGDVSCGFDKLIPREELTDVCNGISSR